jgi:DNA-directed RNA polymerase specialized sigma24 family protein
MFGLKNKYEAQQRSLEHATRNDFETIFRDDMSALHLLALLLTADQEKAEQCFVAGLEESIQENPVFRHWARAWSKRVIIRNAIKMMSPAPGQSNPSTARSTTEGISSERDALMSVVWELPPFERFVFVISVLEGHSVSDSASLLGCSVTDLTRAKSQALSRVALVRDAAATAPRTRKTAYISFFARPELA